MVSSCKIQTTRIRAFDMPENHYAVTHEDSIQHVATCGNITMEKIWCLNVSFTSIQYTAYPHNGCNHFCNAHVSNSNENML